MDISMKETNLFYYLNVKFKTKKKGILTNISSHKGNTNREEIF